MTDNEAFNEWIKKILSDNPLVLEPQFPVIADPYDIPVGSREKTKDAIRDFYRYKFADSQKRFEAAGRVAAAALRFDIEL